MLTNHVMAFVTANNRNDAERLVRKYDLVGIPYLAKDELFPKLAGIERPLIFKWECTNLSSDIYTFLGSRDTLIISLYCSAGHASHS